jgi:hypothetical protein
MRHFNIGYLDGYMFKQSDEDLVGNILTLVQKIRPDLMDVPANKKAFETMVDKAKPHIDWFSLNPKPTPAYAAQQTADLQKDPSNLIRWLHFYKNQPLDSEGVPVNPYSAWDSPIRKSAFKAFPKTIIAPGMDYYRKTPTAMADLETLLRKGAPAPVSPAPVSPAPATSTPAGSPVVVKK